MKLVRAFRPASPGVLLIAVFAASAAAEARRAISLRLTDSLVRSGQSPAATPGAGLSSLAAPRTAGGTWGWGLSPKRSIAQSSLSNEYGESIVVTPDDLSMVRFLPDGGRYCQFLVSISANPHQSRIISLFDTPGGAPRVTVVGEGPVVR